MSSPLSDPAAVPPSSRKYFFRSSIFLVMSLAAAGLNYIYYPLIARQLTPAEFGTAQTLVAILLQIGAIFSGLNLVSIYLVHKLAKADAKRAIGIMQKITSAVFLAASLAVLAAHGWVMDFLHIDDRRHLMLVVLALFTSIPFIMSFGFLQARKRFVAAGTLQLFNSSAKIVIGFFATMRWGVSGALLGFALGQVASMVLFWLLCLTVKIPAWEHALVRSLLPPSRRELSFLKPLAGKIAAIFVLNVTLAVYISFDLLAARHYLVPKISGLYSGASTLSNAIIFVCLPLISVMLPHLEQRGLRHSQAVLWRTASMMALAIVGGLAILALFPLPLLGLFGSEYTVMSYLLLQLGLLMSLAAIITLVLQVSAFFRPVSSSLIAIGGLAVLIVSVMSRHELPSDIAAATLTGFVVILAAGTVQLTRIFKQDEQH